MFVLAVPRSASVPTAVFCAAVELSDRANLPPATLSDPVVLDWSAETPKAVLFDPEPWLLCRADAPTAVFNLPILLRSAYEPTAVLLSLVVIDKSDSVP